MSKCAYTRAGAAALACATLVAAPLAAQDDLFRGRVYPVGYSPQSLVATHLDADADLDLVVANKGGDSLSFLMGQGGGVFERAPDLPIGDAPVQVLAADMNGDGRDDFVTLHTVSAKLELRLNDGSGALLPAFVIAIGGSLPRQVATGDFDEDGALDLVVANEDSDTVSLLRGNGLGGLAPAVTFAVDNIEPTWPANPKGLAVADFDEDGNLDVITANFAWPSTHSLLLGHGDGGFDPAVNFEMAPVGIWGGMQVQAVDLNGDGHLDLSSMINGNTGSVRLGDGAGGFLAPQPPFAPGPGPAAFGDLDGDGDLDGIWPGPSLSVIFGNGLGSSTGTHGYCAGSGPPFPWLDSTIALADLDQDGDLDLACANDDGDDVGLLFNDGTGTFEQPILSTVGTNVDLVDVKLADLDDDGFLDAVTMHYTAPAIRLHAGDGTGAFVPIGSIAMLGAVEELIVADFDADAREDVALLTSPDVSVPVSSVQLSLGDGAGGFTAPVSLPVSGSPHSMAAGDMNGDGRLDIVLANTNPMGVTVRLGDGAGGFGPPLTTSIFGTFQVDRVALAEMNGDGLLDAVVSLPSIGPWWGLRVLYGNGLGGFSSHLDVPAIEGKLVPADLDGDGDTDIVGMSGSFTVWALNTGGGFGPVSHDLAHPGEPLVDDVDRDGDLDIVQMSGEQGTLTCLLNDGAAGFGTRLTFLAGGGPHSGAVGDIDGDGFVDLVAGCDNWGIWFPGRLSVLLNQSPSPWQGLGHALHGSQGAPTLVGQGTLLPHSPVKLSIDHAKPFGSAVLAIGTPAIGAPFKGGVFVPYPSLLIFGLPLNAQGHFQGSGTWYAGLPSGTSIYFQAWIADAAGPYGFSATNGLRGTTP